MGCGGEERRGRGVVSEWSWRAARELEEVPLFLHYLGPPEQALTGMDAQEHLDRWREALTLHRMARGLWEEVVISANFPNAHQSVMTVSA